MVGQCISLRDVQQYGGVAAAKKLVNGPGTSEGFVVLWEKRQLGRSVEAWMLRPEYEALFSDDERQRARRRLEEHKFDVDAYIRNLKGDSGYDM